MDCTLEPAIGRVRVDPVKAAWLWTMIGTGVMALWADAPDTAKDKPTTVVTGRAINRHVMDRTRNMRKTPETAANFVPQHRPSSLVQRFASVGEIANIVVFVASKEAAMTNGAAVRAEGGILDTIT